MSDFFDFHTHRNAMPPGVTGLRSARETIPGVFSSLQILPEENTPEDAALENFYALGEIGLDRRLATPINEQEIKLNSLLNWAELYDKPVVIHCVRAYPELNRALKEFKGMVLLHRFQGSRTELNFQLKMQNRFVSLSPAEVQRRPWILEFFRNNPDFFNRLALESDDEIIDYETFYADVAEKLNIGVETLRSIMHRNFTEFIANGRRVDFSAQ